MRSPSSNRTNACSGGTTPRIEHVALWVRDLDRVCDFYAEHFGAVAGARYENQRNGFASRFLTFGSGARIEIMTSTGLSSPPSETHSLRAGLAHLAIGLGSEEAVDALTARLKSLGIAVVDGPRRTGDGYYESIVLDPEGNRVELTV